MYRFTYQAIFKMKWRIKRLFTFLLDEHEDLSHEDLDFSSSSASRIVF